MNSIYCEECGGIMTYRSTNNVTHKTKWKCKECGHIRFDDYVPFEFKQIRKPEPKHYTCCHGRYDVKKRINGRQYYLGTFKSEALAKKFVALMKASEWDLSRVVEFREACQA